MAGDIWVRATRSDPNGQAVGIELCPTIVGEVTQVVSEINGNDNVRGLPFGAFSHEEGVVVVERIAGAVTGVQYPMAAVAAAIQVGFGYFAKCLLDCNAPAERKRIATKEDAAFTRQIRRVNRFIVAKPIEIGAIATLENSSCVGKLKISGERER